jgi:hypothetical protein
LDVNGQTEKNGISSCPAVCIPDSGNTETKASPEGNQTEGATGSGAIPVEKCLGAGAVGPTSSTGSCDCEAQHNSVESTGQAAPESNTSSNKGDQQKTGSTVINNETGETCNCLSHADEKGETAKSLAPGGEAPKVDNDASTECSMGKVDGKLRNDEKKDDVGASPPKEKRKPNSCQADQQADGDVVGPMPTKAESETNGSKDGNHQQGRQYTRALR